MLVSKHHYQQNQGQQLEGSFTQCYVKHWWLRCMESHSRPQQHTRYQLAQKNAFSCLLKKCLNILSVDNKSCTSINMSELLLVIQKMKWKGAAGPDNIPPTFLKSLGSVALQELLSIFNTSFHLADCPQIWRVATIIPLLKAGKSPSDIASFWPINLTSCVVLSNLTF